MWQDYVFSTGIIVFNLALIPTLVGRDKPAFTTAVPTAFFQFVFVATFASLDMWFSALFTLTLGIMWTVIAFQTMPRLAPQKVKARRR